MDYAKIARVQTPAESVKIFVAQVATDLRQIAYDAKDLEFFRNAVRDYADDIESNDLNIAGAIENYSPPGSYEAETPARGTPARETPARTETPAKAKADDDDDDEPAGKTTRSTTVSNTTSTTSK